MDKLWNYAGRYIVRVLNTAELGKRNNMMNRLFKNKVVDMNCSKKQILYCLKEKNV